MGGSLCVSLSVHVTGCLPWIGCFVPAHEKLVVRLAYRGATDASLVDVRKPTSQSVSVEARSLCSYCDCDVSAVWRALPTVWLGLTPARRPSRA